MATPGITAALIAPFAGERLSDSAAVDAFFQERKGQRYIGWFNSAVADRGAWAGVTLLDSPQNDIGFHQFWNQIGHLFGGDISVVQFISMMSILANEVRGDFSPRTESVGAAGHPGMAYLFDRIEGRKLSYNTLAGNQTAFQCFNDERYVAAHGRLALADRAARTTDQRWSGELWPPEFPTSPAPAVSGFLAQADFMKFRGRGFIQTTGRLNYLPLIEFIQNYQGENSTIGVFQHRWSGKTLDQIAFESLNSDWDALFQQTGLLIATEAIRLHNASSGRYLALADDPGILDGTAPGSVYFMGLRMSGSQRYAATFKQRVVAVLSALTHLPA